MLEPVQFEIEQECAFVARPLICRGCHVERPRSHERAVPRSSPKRWPACPSCGVTTKPVQRMGCATCDQNKGDRCHWHLVSFNVFAGREPAAYRDKIAADSEIMRPLIGATGLQRCERVLAELHAVFPDRIKRDQGNFRVVPEKAIGDALKVLGIIKDDDWDRYECGNMTRSYEPGVHKLIVTLFPTPPEDEPLEADPLGDQTTLPLAG